MKIRVARPMASTVENTRKYEHCLRATVRKYHRMSCLKTAEICFSQFWKLEVWDQGAGMVEFGESLPLGCRMPTSLCITTPLPLEKENQLAPWPFLIRALISFLRASSSWPNYLPNAPPPNTITLGLDFNTWILQGHKHSVHNKQFTW